MGFITSVLALALAASTATASDVYSTFYSDEGQIAPNYDIANNGCFAIEGAVQVSFSQQANGPYCLSAWASGFCDGDATAKQTFGSLSSGTQYALTQEVGNSASYKWDAAGGC